MMSEKERDATPPAATAIVSLYCVKGSMCSGDVCVVQLNRVWPGPGALQVPFPVQFTVTSRIRRVNDPPVALPSAVTVMFCGWPRTNVPLNESGFAKSGHVIARPVVGMSG